MSDIQSFFDAISTHSRSTRGRYQMTLGKLIERLSSFSGKKNVFLVGEAIGHPGDARSYRGYYDDLAFSSIGNPVTCSKLLKLCEQSLGKTFTGYKGGDFAMDEKTPLWISEYGQSSGVAIMAAVETPDRIELVTKLVD